jgi:hypothetical protein
MLATPALTSGYAQRRLLAQSLIAQAGWQATIARQSPADHFQISHQRFSDT